MKHGTLKQKLWLAGMAIAMTAAVPAIAAEQAVHVRGTVTEVTATGFTVQTATGTQNVAMAADTRITGVVPSSLEAIQPGSYIGSANVPQGGAANALEVVVFPPAMKGTGLGDYPWDLPAHGGGSAMTNGSVMSSAMTNGTVKSNASGRPVMQSAMTNGTVKTAAGDGARTLVVDYGSGEKTIKVTASTPIVTFAPADKSAIVKGAHVFVAGKPGNPVAAGLVAVGLNGTAPPM
ncbi:hypothetical protein [Dyella japonica]|uniref:DUF5666 domain-containing protein n=1 Tax=Dyella japonica DSM 16301 TaxID=1440762 RepID=A0A0G9HAC9_9GAMM|nr:hypothetical protein [Dyella japonica]KLD66179.1 hypothetical protein Y882_00440 [Dyella japonica DSM 16301]